MLFVLFHGSYDWQLTFSECIIIFWWSSRLTLSSWPRCSNPTVMHSMWHKIIYFRGSLFLDKGDILCFAGNNFYNYNRLFFFFVGINFCDFHKVPKAQHWQYFCFWVHAIEIHISNMVEPVYCISLYITLFLSERDK